MIKILRMGFFLSLIGALVACGGDFSDEQYVDRAQDYFNKGELKSASIELKNALRQNPDNSQARWLLGKLYLTLGNLPAAEKELSRAKELGLAEELVAPLMAQALLEQGKTEELQEISRDGLPEKAQVTVLSFQALGKMMEGKPDEAAVLIDDALSKNPDSVEALAAKARLLVGRREIKQAREQLNAAFKIDPRYAPAWSLLGDIEQQERNPEKALEAYTKAIDFRRNNFPVRLKRALTLIGLNKKTAAQKDVDVLIKRSPLHPAANYVQGLLYFKENKLKEAQASFDLALVNKERYPQALFLGAITNFMLGNPAKARDYAEGFHARFVSHGPARKLLAVINLAEAKYAEAEELLRPVVEAEEDDVGALNLLAYSLMGQGKSDEAIELLSKVAALQPDSPLAQMRLGAGLLGAGEQESGVEHIEAAIQLDSKLQQADVLLIFNHLRQKQYGEALEVAEAYRKRNPDSAAPHVLIGRVHLAAEREAEAKQAFKKALEIAPGDPLASHTLAASAMREKDYARARDYYHTVLKHHKNYLPTLLNLVALDLLENKEELMVEHIQQARNAHPEAVQPRLLLARYYNSKGEADKVAGLFVDLEGSQVNQPVVLQVIAESQLARKQFTGAKRTLTKLISQQPDSAQAHYLMSQVHAGLGEIKYMQEDLENAIKHEPRHFPARLALARKLWLDKEYDAVNKHLQALKKIAVDHPDVLQLEVALAEQRGDKEEALRISEKAYSKSPSTSSMLMLAKQKWRAGDREGSLALKEKWVAEHPEDVSARASLASSYIAQSKIDAAVEQYRLVIKKDDKNLIALNDLAWYLRDAKPREALEYAQRLNELEPNVTNYMDTLAVVLMENGKIKEAQRLMSKILLKAPKDRDIKYHSAMIDVAAGNREKAQDTLTALLSDKDDFPQRKEAEQLLNKLKAGN